ncbi:MAG: sugar transferase [Sphingomonas fennica]
MNEASHRYEPAAEVAERRPAAQPKSWVRAQIYLTMIASDLASIAVSFFVAALVWDKGALSHQTIPLLVLTLPLYIATAIGGRAYGVECLDGASRGIARALTAFGWTMLIVIGVGFTLKVGSSYSRAIMAIGAIGSSVLMVCGRLLIGWAGAHMLRDGPIAKVILCDGTMVLPARGETVVNTVAMGLAPTLHDPMMLDRLGHAVRNADRVIVACPPERRGAWAMALKGCGIDTELLIPEFDELGVIATNSFEGSVTAVVARGPLSFRNRILKRAFDLAVILWLLPVLVVVTVIVAIAIKLDDRGPVFFVQKRIGEGNRLFPMFKFRSMKVDRLDGSGSKSTARDDDRITRVGRILRSTSVDELPQLFNVLRGDMSIVGPRPHALASTAGDALFWEVDHRYWGRHAAKPGLTGLAQVRGFRGATETETDLTNRVQADLEYLSGWTLLRDIRIVAATFTVILHHNAY